MAVRFLSLFMCIFASIILLTKSQVYFGRNDKGMIVNLFYQSTNVKNLV